MAVPIGLSRRELLSVAAMAACAPAYAQAEAGAEIHVRSVGAGSQSWILIHPFSGSGRFWEARAATLATEHRLRVVSPDLPSHGRSRIVQRFDYDSATDAIADAMAAERASTSLIIGASSGSMVAMKLAARWAKPVVAIGGWLAFSAKNTENMRKQSLKLPPAAAQFAKTFLEQGPAQLAAFQRHFGDLADLGQAKLLKDTESAAIARRALLINGGADNFFSRESAHTLADAIPGSVLSFVSGADHLEPLAAAHRDFTWAQIAAFARVSAATG